MLPVIMSLKYVTNGFLHAFVPLNLKDTHLIFMQTTENFQNDFENQQPKNIKEERQVISFKLTFKTLVLHFRFSS